MRTATPRSWPLILLLVWYGILLIGTGGMFLLALAFGSEAYRGRPIPLGEMAIICATVLITVAFIALTVYLWNTGQEQFVFMLFGLSVIGAAIILLAAGAVI
ncbi:hypothetical protein FGU71_00820 [Erythrobacter insulae]|uniref:Uncharacterized protein n=1 Tax=Erythrobacter insulae TaxID=2584124 RepID=A0A547P8T3_9SPHN|nr:hypothetical protein [Erythrobacter insulae]TRD10550.1 hypothetical protein FGU71_00820 [Erythrobacter insulae]